MRILYLDCFAGISGDMMIGALLDLGLDLADLQIALGRLPLDGYRLEASKVSRGGIQATQFKVILDGPAGEQLADAEFREVLPDQPELEEHGHHHHHHHHAGESATSTSMHRSLREILALIGASDLSDQVKTRATRIFTRLGEAEAQVHGMPPEQVHFHEVGSTDAIIDIVGTAIGLELLGVERIYASALHVGSGFVRAAHGLLPVPAPATANLLTGVPVYTTSAKGELVTPTGAAIVTALANEFGPMPLMIPQAVGYGAGSRERAFPNVLRAHLGEESMAADPPAGRTPFPEQHDAPANPAGYHDGPAMIIEANIDDMNPQLYEHLMERLLEADALDVVLLPVQMKKNRPGTMVKVLAHPDSVDQLLAIIFTESTSIGVRTYEVTKHMLQRSVETVQTRFGPVRVKVARLKTRPANIAPEYEDCRRLARQHRVPLKEVCEAARIAFAGTKKSELSED
jgi:uncharacterized protein (TIGR00299 family) protein